MSNVSGKDRKDKVSVRERERERKERERERERERCVSFKNVQHACLGLANGNIKFRMFP